MSEPLSFPFVVGTDYVSICLPNKAPQVIKSSNPIFEAIIAALKKKDFEAVESLMDPAKMQKYIDEIKSVTKNEVVDIDGVECTGRLAEVIKMHYKNNLPFDHLVNFFRKLNKNTSYRVVNQLYNFIEASMASGGFSFTETGNIIAYKKVRPDYKDIYSGTFNNSVGQTVYMPRNKVDEDPESTCSAGLHFAAFSYLEHYGNGNPDNRIVILEIDPEDIVAIPTDYNNAKGRCCKYKVIGEFVGSYKDSNDDYVQQRPVINNTKAPEQQIRNSNSDSVSDFEALVKKALKSPQVSSPRKAITDWNENYLSEKTISQLADMYAEAVNAYNASNVFSKPLKFRDKSTAINRCMFLKQWLESKGRI